MSTAVSTPLPDPSLYDKDFYAWLFETADLLRQGQYTEVDVAHVHSSPHTQRSVDARCGWREAREPQRQGAAAARDERGTGGNEDRHLL